MSVSKIRVNPDAPTEEDLRNAGHLFEDGELNYNRLEMRASRNVRSIALQYACVAGYAEMADVLRRVAENLDMMSDADCYSRRHGDQMTHDRRKRNGHYPSIPKFE